MHACAHNNLSECMQLCVTAQTGTYTCRPGARKALCISSKAVGTCRVTATQHLFIQCLQPLQSFHKAGVLASRFGLPPPQDTLGGAEEVSDGEVAVLGSYVKAHKVADEGCREEQL